MASVSAQTVVIDDSPNDSASDSSRGGWGAVLALSLCVATLIASEFMPVSILMPIASDLHLTEGTAGQAISISGIFAVITSLTIGSFTPGLDRRALLLGLTVLMLASGLMVAFAPNFAFLMAGRALLGVVIGGFYSMSAATVMRLVSEDQVPRALGLLNGGNALATTVAAPLGSFLGQFIGWRGAFFMVVPLAAITFAWQWMTLPSMPSDRSSRTTSALGVLRRPGAAIGMLAMGLLFMGQFTLFTYIRPFLERTTQLGATHLSIILLVMGAAGLVGSWVIGRAVARSLAKTLAIAPLALAAIALGLILIGSMPVPVAVLLALWGLIGTAVPVAWWTWLARSLPDDAESGGGLMVAVIQLSITLGAAGGGMLFDAGGYRATFVASAALLGAAAIAAVIAGRGLRGEPQQGQIA